MRQIAESRIVDRSPGLGATIGLRPTRGCDRVTFLDETCGREAAMSICERRQGGRILVDQLVAQGVERLTCVPGESYLAVLDALYAARVDVIVCRNEGGAAMM